MRSIEKRILAIVGLSQLLLVLTIAGIGVYYTRHRLLSAFDAELRGRAMSVAALVHYKDEAGTQLGFDTTLLPSQSRSGEPDVFAIVASNTGLLAKSATWPPELSLSPRSGITTFRESGEYRGLWVQKLPVMDEERPANPPVLAVFYAAPVIPVQRKLAETAGVIVGTSIAALLIALAATFLAVRRGLLPLRSLATETEKISANNWKLELPTADPPEELRPLVGAFHAMLARLQEAFTQQREFLGNAAHELKTPVATVKSTLQSLQTRRRTAEEYSEGVEQALDDLQRLEKLLFWMLRLARAEQFGIGNRRSDLEVVDIADTCEAAIERVAAMARAREVTLSFVAEGSAALRADPEDLQIVWVNLLENAIRYSPPNEAVELELAINDEHAEIVVRDHGPGIPDAHVARAFGRFHRGDESRSRETGGFGLGLSIAKAFVEAYGGRIELRCQRGPGTCMYVRLPLSQEQVVLVPSFG